jgi:predicted glycosyltransferase
MRVIIDVLTPKQLMFFPKLAERLEDRGHETLMTTRKYREVSQLIQKREIVVVAEGEVSGASSSQARTESSASSAFLTISRRMPPSPSPPPRWRGHRTA